MVRDLIQRAFFCARFRILLLLRKPAEIYAKLRTPITSYVKNSHGLNLGDCSNHFVREFHFNFHPVYESPAGLEIAPDHRARADHRTILTIQG